MEKIRLQGVGLQKAKPAGEIKVGDILIWNYGWKSQVLGIIKETRTQIVIRTYSEVSGFIHERRLGKKRLVAFNEGRSLL